MDISNFDSGSFQTQNPGTPLSYKAFIPTIMNKEWSWANPSINTLLEESSSLLSKLNTIASYVPNSEQFIRMYLTKESQLSNKIEGTQTTFEEAIVDKEMISVEKRDDWEEVQNYIFALQHGIEKLKKFPISTRLIKETHKELLKGVRGKTKQPGSFRISQNWIGGVNLQTALFVPPPHYVINELMSDLDCFLNNDSIQVPYLIRAALAHYQFETIHPFLDGNGRLGRLLIILFLIDKEMISKPVLYISNFFETNRSSYYDALTTVRTQNNLEQWLLFFLEGIKQTSEHSISIIQKIQSIRKATETKLNTLRNKHLAFSLLDYLFSHPITTSQAIYNKLTIAPSTTHLLLTSFEKLGIVEETTGQKRNRLYKFTSYLTLFKEGSWFIK